MKIGIIGASSFLASDLIQIFDTKQHQLSLFSRSNRWATTQHHWQAFDFPNQPLSYDHLMGLELLYYCAGAGIQPKHNDDNSLIYEMNAFEPIRLINALKERGFTGKLVCFGSYFEIGNDPLARQYTEDMLATHSNPVPNAYCTAKNLLTRFIHTELRQENKLNFCLQHFVLSTIYGVNENPNRLIPYIVASALKNQPLQFTAGVQERQYTHINDISTFLKLSTEHQKSGIYNLTANGTYTVKEVIQTVLKILHETQGVQPKVTFGGLDKRDVSMKYLALNTDQFQKCFNFEPSTTLEEGILEYIQHYGNN